MEMYMEKNEFVSAKCSDYLFANMGLEAFYALPMVQTLNPKPYTLHPKPKP